MKPAELQLYIGTLRIDAAAAGGSTAALREAVVAAIGARLGGTGAAQPPSALVDAIAGAVQARVASACPDGSGEATP